MFKTKPTSQQNFKYNFKTTTSHSISYSPNISSSSVLANASSLSIHPSKHSNTDMLNKYVGLSMVSFTLSNYNSSLDVHNL